MNEPSEHTEELISFLPPDIQKHIYAFLCLNFLQIKDILDDVFSPYYLEQTPSSNILNLLRFRIDLRDTLIVLPENFVSNNGLHRMNCLTIYPSRFFINDGTTDDNRPQVILSLYTITFSETGNSYVPYLVTRSDGTSETHLLPYIEDKM